MTSFAEISSEVQRFHSNERTAEQLETYFQSLNRDDCNKWKIHNGKFTEFLSTWRVKNEDIVPEPANQPDDLDNCWALALEIGQSALVKLKGYRRAFLSANVLMEEVHSRFRAENYGVDRLEDLTDFMVGKYVRQMIVHHRPRELDEDVQEKFEKLIEKLLRKGPVVVAFDVFFSYSEEFVHALGQGIFIPTEVDGQLPKYQRFPRHCVVLFGKGVEVHGSAIHEFWEALESRGRDFGDEGFVRLGRHQYVIREVVELEV